MLLLVGRECNPAPEDWNDLSALSRFHVGVVSRASYIKALAAMVIRDGGDMMAPHDAAVTVGGGCSWLGPSVRWRTLSSLDAMWWGQLRSYE